MNHCYRVVWNHVYGVWQAVAETARSRKKSASIKVAIGLQALFYEVSGYAAPPVSAPPANALPTGGQVVYGSSIISQTGNVLNIQQNTQKSIINWQSYNIGSASTVNYLQSGPSAISLNRVVGQDPSAIFGKLNANGQVWLINPNGILFGKGAQINVGGLLASTLDISDNNFISGDYRFFGSQGSVVNSGEITAADGGYVAMLAPEVRNEGVIRAISGQVTMAAGDAMTLDFTGSGLINVQVDSANVNTLVDNQHLIQVGNGQVLMSTKAADGIQTSVINNSGRIEADSLVSDGGVVRLVGAKKTLNSGSISAKSARGKGGTVHLLGDHVGVVDQGSVDVSGSAGGGHILVGGDYQGKNSNIQNANRTYISQDARLIADATDQGNGGTVIVWADDITRYFGTISAKGGKNGGNGGFAEVSGKRLLNFLGKADLSAANGRGGSLLLDPTNITLSNGADTNTTGFTVPGDLTEAFGDDAGLNSIFNVAAGGSFAGIAAGSTITLQATNDITIANAFNLDTATGSTDNSLVLQANNNINVNAAVTTSGTGSITMNADADNSGAGTLAIGANNITAQSGGITLSGASVTKTTGVINSTGAASANGGNISITATGLINLGAGTISTNGGGAATAGNAGNINISAGTGFTMTGALIAGGTASTGPNTAGGNGGNISVSSTTGNVTTGAITTTGGNAGAGTANGSNAGNITVTALAGNTTTGTLTARTGSATGTGASGAVAAVNVSGQAVTVGAINTSGQNNGNGGSITVNATTGALALNGAITSAGGTALTGNTGKNAGTVTLTSGSTITAAAAATITASGSNGVGANQSGGNGAAVSLSANGTISGRAITANGGNGVATNAAGGNAGSISITTTAGNITTNARALNARTGAGIGTGASASAGFITINNTSAAGTIATGALSTAGNNNGAGGNISVTGNGNVTVAGAISSSGGATTGVRAGRNAGNITISGATRSVTGAITASGSNGVGANQNGGNAGAVNITGSGGATVTTVTASGGAASATNANGGNAGAINISNSGTGNIVTTGLTSRGGAGTGTGAGGAAGGVTLTNTAAAGNVTTTGNIATNGNNNVHGGNVNISSLGNASVSGSINTSGGASTGARAGRNAGNVTITGVNRTVGGAITASGGAGIGTNQAGGNAGVVSITGTGTLNTAAITARTGNATGSGAGGVAGSVTLSGSSVTAGALSTQRGTNGAGGVVNVTTTGVATSSVASINADNNAAVNMNVADTLTVAGVIQGAGVSVNKSGTGTLVLSGANTYTGATNVNAGTLRAQSATALGGTGTGTTVASGATLNVNNVTLANEPITINGAGVGGAGALTGTGAAVVGGNVTAASASTVGTTSAASSLTINGVVNAPNTMSIVGAGDVTATNAANNFSTVNINGANDVSLRDTNAITLGGGASNLTGNLTVQAGGNVTVANNVATTGGDITLAGTNFINTAGASALSASGRWLVYANTHTGNTFGGLNSGNQAVWGTTYPTAVAATGNRYVFGNSPTVTVTSTNQTKTYGQDGAPIVANAYTATGFINAATFGNVFTQDTIANSLTGSATSTGSPTTANVGGYAIDVTPITATTGYTLNRNSTGVLTVNPAALTITANNQTKTYGNTFTFAGTEFTTGVGQLQNGETVTSVVLTSPGAANNANVGSYAIAGSGATGAGGFNAANYAIIYIDGTMTVDPAVINLSGTRSYNATNTFNATAFGTINGVLGQTLTLGGAGSVASPNAGAAQPLTLGSLALADGTGLASNYTLSGGTHTGTITAATLNLNAVTDVKVYDGGTGSSGVVGVSGLFGSDSVNSLTQSFVSKNVLGTNGSTLVVDAGYVVNDGNGGNNYTVVTNSASGTITPLAITGSVTANNKTYDGNDSAVIATRSLSGVIGADDVTYTGGSATFDNKNSGIGKTVTATGLGLTGADAANYTVNSTTTTTADIAKATLNLNAVSDTKTYDANTSSSGAVAAVGLQGTDTVTVTQSFASKDVLGVNGSTLNVNGSYTVNDGNGGNNYDVTLNSATGTINPAALSVTANNRTKTYGQTVNFAGTEFTAGGLVGGETIGSVSLASAGAVNTANVAGGPYAITASNATGGTFDPNNYTITYNDGSLAVNPAALTIRANNVSKVQGAANPVFSSTFIGFVNGENASVLNGSLVHTTSAITSSPAGLYNITPSGLTADNYVITFVDGTLTVTTPRGVSGAAGNVFNNSLLRPELAKNECGSNSENIASSMINGLEAYGLEDVEYKAAVNQPLIADAVANGLVSPSCLKL